jgi:hypothetical protein
LDTDTRWPSNLRCGREKGDPSAKLGAYCRPRPVSDADLKLMRRIYKLHMEFPFAGSRMLQGMPGQEGV